jgi:hypothetical protein
MHTSGAILTACRTCNRCFARALLPRTDGLCPGAKMPMALVRPRRAAVAASRYYRDVFAVGVSRLSSDVRHRAKFRRAGWGLRVLPAGARPRAEPMGPAPTNSATRSPSRPRKIIWQADGRINRRSPRQPTRMCAQSLGFCAREWGAANAPGFQKRDSRVGRFGQRSPAGADIRARQSN